MAPYLCTTLSHSLICITEIQKACHYDKLLWANMLLPYDKFSASRADTYTVSSLQVFNFKITLDFPGQVSVVAALKQPIV